MIVKPSVTELLEKVDNRYTLAVMSSKRARQIAAGAPVLTKVKEKSPVTLAVNEIAEGTVRKVEPKQEISEENEESINKEDEKRAEQKKAIKKYE